MHKRCRRALDQYLADIPDGVFTASDWSYRPGRRETLARGAGERLARRELPLQQLDLHLQEIEKGQALHAHHGLLRRL